jgi:6-pyruvoyltetrahydropterin/6-carboxytetrahydropterin synthase
MITVTRFHDFSYGHRVVGHEGKCCNLHGHNGRVHFTCTADNLDDVGRVVDFSVIKTALCDWLEDWWDHRMLLWVKDPWVVPLRQIDRTVKTVPFNPTAENMAQHLLHVVGPTYLRGTGVTLTKVVFEETRKCSAEMSL